jgi:hypothetical protein
MMADKTSEVPADYHELASRPWPVSDFGTGGRCREQIVLMVGIDLL